MQTVHVATVHAFANKYGDFSGAVRYERTKVIVRERFETLAAAKFWAQTKACKICGPVRYAPLRRKGEYLANCWQ